MGEGRKVWRNLSDCRGSGQRGSAAQLSPAPLPAPGRGRLVGLMSWKAKSARLGWGMTGAFPVLVWALVLIGSPSPPSHTGPSEGGSVAEVAMGASLHQGGGRMPSG